MSSFFFRSVSLYISFIHSFIERQSERNNKLVLKCSRCKHHTTNDANFSPLDYFGFFYLCDRKSWYLTITIIFIINNLVIWFYGAIIDTAAERWCSWILLKISCWSFWIKMMMIMCLSLIMMTTADIIIDIDDGLPGWSELKSFW